jgi:hypothetical protein
VSPDRLDDARGRALDHLAATVTDVGFQSSISETPDMSRPVEHPSTYFGDRDDWPLEIFTSAVVLELAYALRPDDPVAVRLAALVADRRDPAGHLDFMFEPDLLPTDVDTTAVGLSALLRRGTTADEPMRRTIDRIVDNVDDHGVIEVYLPPAGERRYVDAAVCANVLHLLALSGDLHRAGPTIDHLASVLAAGGAVDGTRYYPSPDALVVFASRLVAVSDELRERVGEPLRPVVTARLGASDIALDRAMRSTAAAHLGLAADADLTALLDQQLDDGSWPAHALYRFGRRHGFFGSTPLVTAFAVAAIDGALSADAR